MSIKDYIPRVTWQTEKRDQNKVDYPISASLVKTPPYPNPSAPDVSIASLSSMLEASMRDGLSIVPISNGFLAVLPGGYGATSRLVYGKTMHDVIDAYVADKAKSKLGLQPDSDVRMMAGTVSKVQTGISNGGSGGSGSISLTSYPLTPNNP